MIIMETFLKFVKEMLKGIVRAIITYIFRKTFLDKEKSTRHRDKQQGGNRK